jgi:hypothetical protein
MRTVTGSDPPEPPPHISGPFEERHRGDEEELLDVAESRRATADQFAWTVPGLAVTAEAFLLSIALNESTEPAGRLVAVIAGSLIVLGALHFIEKQSHNFDLYDALIERQRMRLKRMSMYREVIEGLDLPDHINLVKRRERGWFARGLGAVALWRWILIGVLVINLVLAGYAIYEWRGNDPGWLSEAMPAAGQSAGWTRHLVR